MESSMEIPYKKRSVHMYVNEKMKPDEIIPGMGRGKDKRE
jgi:hypothetical protein